MRLLRFVEFDADPAVLDQQVAAGHEYRGSAPDQRIVRQRLRHLRQRDLTAPHDVEIAVQHDDAGLVGADDQQILQHGRA